MIGKKYLFVCTIRLFSVACSLYNLNLDMPNFQEVSTAIALPILERSLFVLGVVKGDLFGWRGVDLTHPALRAPLRGGNGGVNLALQVR